LDDPAFSGFLLYVSNMDNYVFRNASIAARISGATTRIAYIKKEKGKYCVKSEKNPSWSGGCFDTKEEAETQLKNVEMFKHMKGKKKEKGKGKKRKSAHDPKIMVQQNLISIKNYINKRNSKGAVMALRNSILNAADLIEQTGDNSLIQSIVDLGIKISDTPGVDEVLDTAALKDFMNNLSKAVKSKELEDIAEDLTEVPYSRSGSNLVAIASRVAANFKSP
jgi:hypothetical protein